MIKLIQFDPGWDSDLVVKRIVNLAETCIEAYKARTGELIFTYYSLCHVMS